ncbi:DUF397 domain-containing protein [Streptomyces sp. NBC_01465]|uniref:DUF397 domain-containing protein n=1 Tax=Streptomyces sp. NBC_01465 TaxID=2903878 RepID=UPI002E367F28|nr:DUF397 domain-containing protein [Streptomyces sp. NBC_01465]
MPADLNWQKSSYSSEGSNCVELATAPDGTIHLRESDAPAITLTLHGATLTALLAATSADYRAHTAAQHLTAAR